MKYFVTGGAGFVGSHLIKKLKGDVISYDNLSVGKCEDHLVTGDILDYDKLVKEMAGSDMVIHLAAFANIRLGLERPELDFFNNLIGTHNVLMAMKQNGIKDIVFFSSCSVYGDAPISIVESASLDPLSPYALEKMKCEWIIQGFVEQYGFRAFVFRPGSIIGGDMQNGMIRDWVLKLKKDKTKLRVLGGTRTSRPFIYIDDVVDAVLFAIGNLKDKYQVFNLASDGSVNVGRAIEMLLDEAGITDIEVALDPQDRGWEGSALEVCISVDKLSKLGWKAKVSPAEAVRKACKEILVHQGLE